MASATQKVGNRSEACLLAALSRRYDRLLLPFGDGSRYDIVADCPVEGFVRIQCKTGRLLKGAVVFSTASTYGHHRQEGNPRRVYVGEIDYFAVWCEALAKGCLVPIGSAPGKSTQSLRVQQPRNNQMAGIMWARDYEI